MPVHRIPTNASLCFRCGCERRQRPPLAGVAGIDEAHVEERWSIRAREVREEAPGHVMDPVLDEDALRRTLRQQMVDDFDGVAILLWRARELLQRLHPRPVDRRIAADQPNAS